MKTPTDRLTDGRKPPSGGGGREYEFVAANVLFDSLLSLLRTRYLVTDACRGHERRLISYIVAAVGCDFTDGIPRCGPGTVWKNLPLIWRPLQNAYDPDTSEFDVRAVAGKVIAPLLRQIHAKHVNTVAVSDVGRVLTSIRASPTLTVKARDALPTEAQIASLLRTCCWVCLYWHFAPDAPEAAQKRFGFARVQKSGNVIRDADATLDD